MSAAGDHSDLATATKSYVDAADRFCKELARAGEPDFDGLLRQAVLVLDSAPGAGTNSGIIAPREALGGKGASKSGTGGKGGSKSGDKSGGKSGGKGKGGKAHGGYGGARSYSEEHSGSYSQSYYQSNKR